MNENFRISIRRQQVRVFVNKTQTETVSNPFNLQSEFTALQGAIINELETRVWKSKIVNLNIKYIVIKMV